jgi:hypothetical protein
MKSYWATELQEVVVSVDDSNLATWVYLPVAGDPSSIGDHVDQALRDNCQSPLPKEEWDARLNILATQDPVTEPSLKDKLDTLGIPLADLKAALEAL